MVMILILSGTILENGRNVVSATVPGVGGITVFRRMTMTEPLDTPDYFDKPSTRDAEVRRLKEDVRALSGLLMEARRTISKMKADLQWMQKDRWSESLDNLWNELTRN